MVSTLSKCPVWWRGLLCLQLYVTKWQCKALIGSFSSLTNFYFFSFPLHILQPFLFPLLWPSHTYLHFNLMLCSLLPCSTFILYMICMCSTCLLIPFFVTDSLLLYHVNNLFHSWASLSPLLFLWYISFF